MRDSNIKDGKIVFVSSMLGMLSFAGWSTYSPTKYAVRGLADTLRNELKRYDIGVHIFFPGGIESPGFDTENLTKPEITKLIEGANTPQTGTECAQSLLNGLRKGNYMIVTDAIGEVLRAVTRGVSPTNNLVLDWIMATIGQVKIGFIHSHKIVKLFFYSLLDLVMLYTWIMLLKVQSTSNYFDFSSGFLFKSANPRLLISS